MLLFARNCVILRFVAKSNKIIPIFLILRF